mgnify:CR=1 FL=1
MRARACGRACDVRVLHEHAQAKKYKASGKPLLWDFDDLLEYAEGNIAPVFNKCDDAPVDAGVRMRMEALRHACAAA